MGVPRLSQRKIVKLVSQLSGLTQTEVKTVINDYVTVLRSCCFNGFEVTIPLVGVLSVKYKAYREPVMRPNVNYGGEMMLTSAREEHNIPTFRMSKYFIEEMREATWKKPVYVPQSHQKKDGDNDIDDEEADDYVETIEHE